MTIFVSSFLLGSGFTLVVALAFVTGFLLGTGGATRAYKRSIRELERGYELSIQELGEHHRKQLTRILEEEKGQPR